MKYCTMGNPGAGNVPSMPQHETAEQFPIRFIYFEAPDDALAYEIGVNMTVHLAYDGCYIFACNEEWKVTHQVVKVVPKPANTEYKRR